MLDMQRRHARSSRMPCRRPLESETREMRRAHKPVPAEGCTAVMSRRSGWQLYFEGSKACRWEGQDAHAESRCKGLLASCSGVVQLT
jgi:hypothetical protein